MVRNMSTGLVVIYQSYQTYFHTHLQNHYLKLNGDNNMSMKCITYLVDKPV